MPLNYKDAQRIYASHFRDGNMQSQKHIKKKKRLKISSLKLAAVGKSKLKLQTVIVFPRVETP